MYADDEVCCVAGEALDPARNMPRAVLGTLAIVTFCYVLAALALTGMIPWNEINPTSGFPDAFEFRGHHLASQISAIGEIVCLPIVVLVSLLAQPRLTLSMAHDGLLPPIFAQLDANGNLYGGTLVCGLVMTFIATFIRKSQLMASIELISIDKGNTLTLLSHISSKPFPILMI
jgi:APA family basic amino acid/polyamine antiporter